MTVVLFSSIFAWVTTFPVPPAQNTTQFSANLVLTANQSYVKAIQITHLAGPSVPGGTLVYLKSAFHPGAAEFQTPIVASSYLPNPTTWNLGQTFNYTFPCPTMSTCQQPQLPDNLTVLLVTSNQVVFSTILPGTLIAVPPNFVATSISPAGPTVAASFTINAYVSGNTGGAAVYVTLKNIPGLAASYPAAQKMTFVAATNRWTFTVPALLTTTNGTYYAFVNITNPLGQAATAGVAITIVSSSSGPTAPSLSVAVVMIPQPPTLPNASAYFAALVTYSGSGSALGLGVTFWVNQTPGSFGMPSAWLPSSTVLTGPSGLTISGPSTETVYSSVPSTFANWLLNSSIVISARGTVTTVGSATGSTNFATANLVSGWVAAFPSTGFAHTCTLTCPFLNDTVYNNWTNAVTFSGKMYVNLTGVNKNTYTIGTTTVPAAGHVTTSGPGATTRWKPATAGTYIVTTALTVTYSGVTIGYIWDTFTIVVT